MDYKAHPRLQQRVQEYYKAFPKKLKSTSARIMLPEEEVLYSLPLMKYIFRFETTPTLFFIERGIQQFQVILEKTNELLGFDRLQTINFKLTDPRKVNLLKQVNGLSHEYASSSSLPLADVNMDIGISGPLEKLTLFRKESEELIKDLYYSLRDKGVIDLQEIKFTQYPNLANEKASNLITGLPAVIGQKDLKKIRYLLKSHEAQLIDQLSGNLTLQNADTIHRLLEEILPEALLEVDRVLFIDDSIYSGGSRLAALLLGKVWQITTEFITVGNYKKTTQGIVDAYVTENLRLIEDWPWSFTTIYREKGQLLQRFSYEDIIDQNLLQRTDLHSVYTGWQKDVLKVFRVLNRRYQLTNHLQFLSEIYKTYPGDFDYLFLEYFLRGGDYCQVAFKNVQ